MYKNYLLGLLIGLSVFGGFSVTPVSANTNEEQYRETLFALIAVLQQQISELQAELESKPKIVENNSGMLHEIEGELVASYSVFNQTISTRANDSYQIYFDRLLEVLPDQYDDYIDELVVFTGGDDGVGAYVETSIPYTKDWRYAVRASEINEDPDSRASTELMVHEFAHIFSFDQVFRIGDFDLHCHSYFADEVCYTPDSYLGKFVAEFWSEQILDQLQDVQKGSDSDQKDFYKLYQSDFVSDYAATDPAEDFAESFTWYVYKEPVPPRSVASEKIEFFDRFSYTKELAESIRKSF